MLWQGVQLASRYLYASAVPQLGSAKAVSLRCDRTLGSGIKPENEEFIAMGFRRSVTLINAPSNLGLWPLRSGNEPGTWRAPEVLAKARLIDALTSSQILNLERRTYNPHPDAVPRHLNGAAIR